MRGPDPELWSPPPLREDNSKGDLPAGCECKTITSLKRGFTGFNCGGVSNYCTSYTAKRGKPTRVYPREVIKRALELSATTPILVHNHPFGDPPPSQAEIQMTKAIINIPAPPGIAAHNHIIIGERCHASRTGYG